MLDTDTKRRIDTARDILVGKVPDPKSQVEQITIALIYKFMDDMDAEAEEFGGKRKFFAGEFERYGWAKLMRSGLGGHEMLGLYGEAIAKMPENPGIPLLFRDIFKNAYLPYRDPETLRAFLKIIDEFSYDHSEKLGDAYEYLLSVLGSQGNAGQFRTPRHIIDFIVDVIDPKKTDTLLDPACGSAGFLISSYKHILKANTDKKGHSTLTPDEKGRLAKNITGYDIDPLMVRLSLVNLYLHGFADPHIHEYDSLSRQERWNETADIILANPPFMSPKGGITPHNRFTVKSKRSEVLFVDYMAEHLRPNGRAGIIVPEGVIFQSQNAYKQLRKNLVEDYLVAVVSLPAGVFQPYSGVKTSILLFDKALAKKSNSIAFYKIEQDGFSLGAQRRETGKSDLPAAAEFLKDWLQGRARPPGAPGDGNDGRLGDASLPPAALIVPKEKIAENGEYNLSGERYQEVAVQTGNYPWFKIESLIKTVTPPCKIQKTAFGTSGRFPIIDQSQNSIAGWTDDESALIRPEKPLVIFGDHTCAVKLVETPFAQGADGIKILQTADSLDPRFLFEVIRARPLESVGYQRHYSLLKEMKIPLPPLEIQKEIVAEIEGYQNVIDGARAVLDHYRPHIPIHPDWPMVALSEACEKIMDGTHFSPSNTETGERLYLTSKNVRENYLDLSNISYISEEDHKAIYSRCPVRTGDVLYIKDGANTGLAAINTLTEEFSLLSSVAVMRGKPEIMDNRYLVFYLNSERGRQSMLSMISGVAITRLTLTKLNAAVIPLPPLAEQQAIVAEIEAEQALVNANHELIKRMEAKIQSVLSRIWGENGDATPPAR